MNKKQVYFCREKDEDLGIAVIATTPNHAKKIAMNYLNCAWIEVRIQVKKVDVSDLPIGIMKDELKALKLGIFYNVSDIQCPNCGANNVTVYYEGEYYCRFCEEDVLYNERCKK